jgi:hypothetical protein
LQNTSETQNNITHFKEFEVYFFFFTISYLIHTYLDSNITAISDVLISTASLIKEVSGHYASLIGSDCIKHRSF